MPEYEQWEFIAFVDDLIPSTNGTEDRLNRMGRQGWQLVSVVPYRPATIKGMVAPPPKAVFYMKRPSLSGVCFDEEHALEDQH